MARAPRQKNRAFHAAIRFWLFILILSAAAGFASFRVGRDWLGKRMGDVEVAGAAPRIVAQSRVDPDEAARDEAEAKAPAKAVVTLEDREPTRQERLRALGDAPEDLDSEAQDGAGLNRDEEARDRKRAEDADAEADSPGSDDGEGSVEATRPKPKPKDKPAKTATSAGSGGRYSVTAGSYSDADAAAKVMARLSAKGYSPYVEKITRNGKTLRRVTVAEVKGRDKANDLRDELESSGMDAGVSSAE